MPNFCADDLYVCFPLKIGIRTIPEFSGPRTGEGLYPGEVVEVIHSFDVFDEDGAEG